MLVLVHQSGAVAPLENVVSSGALVSRARALT